MKKYRKRIIPALLLSVLLLLSSCQSDTPSVTENTEPSVNVTAAEPITTQTPETEEPLPVETETEETDENNSSSAEDFTFLKQKESESFLGSAHEDSPLYLERDEILSEKYGIKIRESLCNDIVKDSENLWLSGDESDLLSLNLVSEGVPLMLRGELQDLSETGIDITPSASYTYKELAEACAFGTRTYLLPFKGLSSAFTSAWVLCCNAETETATALYKSFKDNTYTLEKVMEAVCSTEPFLGASDTEEAAAALLTASGFLVMTHGSSCPGVETESWSAKSGIFESVASLSAMLGEDENFEYGELSIRRVSEISSSAYLVLPLPVSENDRDDRTATPVNPGSVTVIAAPAGLIYGRRAAAALDAIYESSEKIIAGYSAVPGLASDTVPLILSRSLTLDGARIFTWGDLGSLAVSTLLSGNSLSSFTGASDFSARLKAFTASAEIYSERLN